MKVLCTDCGREFKCIRTGILVKELFQKNTQVYGVWAADLLGCPECDKKVVTRFADKSIASHWEKEKMQHALTQCALRKPGFDLFEWKEFVPSNEGDYLPKFLRRKEIHLRSPIRVEKVTQGDPRKA